MGSRLHQLFISRERGQLLPGWRKGTTQADVVPGPDARVGHFPALGQAPRHGVHRPRPEGGPMNLRHLEPDHWTQFREQFAEAFAWLELAAMLAEAEYLEAIQEPTPRQALRLEVIYAQLGPIGVR